MINYEAEVREVASHFPTDSMAEAIHLAEIGRLTWEQVHRVVYAAMVQANRVGQEMTEGEK